MDKVGPLGPAFVPRRDDSAARKGRGTAGTAKPGFLGLLRQVTEPTAPNQAPGTVEAGDDGRALEALLDEVHAAGQELAKNPSPDHVVAYKRSVAAFVRRVVAGSVDLVEVEGRLRKDLRKPKYAILRVIDEKLEKLGAYVLQNQKDRLEILRKVDELHGLLVDLRH